MLMDKKKLNAEIRNQYTSFPRQVRIAAQFVLDNPHDVTMMSMRKQAKIAGVPPATMTRLAKKLGFSGYDSLREIFINDIKEKKSGYGDRAQELIDLNNRIGENALVLELANNIITHIRSLCSEENLESILRASEKLSNAQNIYCLGLRSSYPVAFQFTHVASYFTNKTCLIDGAGESSMMSVLHNITNEDVVIVCCIPPYSKRTVSITNYLARMGVKVISITDSASSPTALRASEVILVNKSTPSFFDTITPALFASEVLVALLAATSKQDVRLTVTQTEEKLWSMEEWFKKDA